MKLHIDRLLCSLMVSKCDSVNHEILLANANAEKSQDTLRPHVHVAACVCVCVFRSRVYLSATACLHECLP